MKRKTCAKYSISVGISDTVSDGWRYKCVAIRVMRTNHVRELRELFPISTRQLSRHEGLTFLSVYIPLILVWRLHSFIATVALILRERTGSPEGLARRARCRRHRRRRYECRQETRRPRALHCGDCGMSTQEYRLCSARPGRSCWYWRKLQTCRQGTR